VYNLSALMSFPFIFVSHNILNKEDKSHVKGMLKVRVSLIRANGKAQAARVWAGQACSNNKNHEQGKLWGHFD